jgi:uncharacterized protein YeaC (DUF1315 family)
MENTFQNLKVWQKAHNTVLKIYKTTKTFPSDERYRLVDQICRSMRDNIYQELMQDCQEIGKMLTKLIQYLKSKI